MRRILPVTLVFLLSGCTVPVVEQVPVAEVQPIPVEGPLRPLVLDRVIFDVAKGATIGEIMRGFCLNAQPIKWTSDPIVMRAGDYHNEFEKLALKYNFKLPPKPTSMFETTPPTGDELVLAARITNIRETRCSTLSAWTNKQVYKGSVRFAVHWEIYSLADLKVVFALDNEGSATLNEFTVEFDDWYYPTAFGNALKGLLQNPDFRKIVVSFPKPRNTLSGSGT